MNIQPIILAAGKGSRMKTNGKGNKCMLPLHGKPMLEYPILALEKITNFKPIIVVGHASSSIKDYFKDRSLYAVQTNPKGGTADALRAGMKHVGSQAEDVIVLYGDHCAFYTVDVLQNLIDHHLANDAAMTLITVVKKNPYNYGRILRQNGKIVGIVEEKNASHQQRQIKEINTGNAIYSLEFLETFLPQIEKNEITNEYYLTDIVALGIGAGEKIATLTLTDERLSLGVNTPEQYAQAQQAMRSFSR